MKVLVTDPIASKGLAIMEQAGLRVDVKTGLSPEDLQRTIGEYDGLVIRSATQVTAAVLAAAKNLKVVGRAGSGLDNVDVEAATKQGVVVMNTPGGNTVTTAEHTLGMLFAVARNIPQACQSLKAGRWEKKKFMGVELYNKTLGVIGLGNIGGVVVSRAQALQMHIVAYDPYIAPEKAREMGVELVDLPELYRRSDFITVHTPLTKETRHLIDKAAIAQMKDGVRLINCARGGIVNEADLLEALKSGKVAAAAFDVFEEEPAVNNPLLALDNFIGTPHLGASTEEAQVNVAVAVAEQIVDYLIHGLPRNAVNVPTVPPDVLHKIQPYLVVAERLGSLAAQLYEGPLTQVNIAYMGEVADLNVAPITIAALKGLLTPILEEPVNYVNAPVIARDRGIQVLESKSSEAGDYPSLITLRVMGGKQPAEVAGTLYGRKDPRIVSIDGMRVEVVPEGYMLILSNVDRPGVIGNIGTFLGEHQINIARLQLGREKPGGKAVAVVSVDNPVSDELLREMSRLPNILSVKQVKV